MRKKSIYIYRRNTDILKKYYYFDKDASQNATRKKGGPQRPADFSLSGVATSLTRPSQN